MGGDNKEPKLTYALDSSGKMVHISSVERGLSCNCRCPKCNEFLVAKLGHEGGRQAHFAHQNDSECHGAYMSALHKLAEQIIEEEMAVMVPAYKEINKQKLKFEKVEVEQRVERKDLQPDIVGVTSDGLRWFIEIRNTHEVDETKRAKLIESDITCLEIDVREQTLENLKSFLLESAESREWINNPNYEAQIAEAKRVKVSQVEKLLFDTKAFVIPAYGKYKSQKIHFDKLSVVQNSDDGLFVRVKAYSTEGIPYVFNIGGRESLVNMTPLLKNQPECNELAINANSVYSDSTIHSCFLETKWLYHCQSEKEHEAKIIEYRSNPQYEVRPKTVCSPIEPLHDGLPFDRFWTTDEFYSQLQSTGSYNIENGLLAEVVKCGRTDGGILLLYRDSAEVRTYWPFHLVIIHVSNGNLLRKKVADFTNRKAALDSYYLRLRDLRANVFMKRPEGISDNELPF